MTTELAEYIRLRSKPIDFALDAYLQTRQTRDLAIELAEHLEDECNDLRRRLHELQPS